MNVGDETNIVELLQADRTRHEKEIRKLEKRVDFLIAVALGAATLAALTAIFLS